MSKLIHEAHAVVLKHISLKVLFSLATYDKGEGIFPTEKTIHTKSGLFRSQVECAKLDLRAKGFISWEVVPTKNGKNICRYKIEDKAFKAPEGWESHGHYFMHAISHKNAPPECWRFLCLVNTVNGWAHVSSLRQRLKFWGMGLGHYKKMTSKLDSYLKSDRKVSSDLIYKVGDEAPDLGWLYE